MKSTNQGNDIFIEIKFSMSYKSKGLYHVSKGLRGNFNICHINKEVTIFKIEVGNMRTQCTKYFLLQIENKIKIISIFDIYNSIVKMGSCENRRFHTYISQNHFFFFTYSLNFSQVNVLSNINPF